MILHQDCTYLCSQNDGQKVSDEQPYNASLIAILMGTDISPRAGIDIIFISDISCVIESNIPSASFRRIARVGVPIQHMLRQVIMVSVAYST